MKKLIIGAAALALVALLTACSGDGDDPTATTGASGATGATDATGAELDITIADFSFSAPSTAAVGDTVTVTNEDSIGHTWTAVDGEFNSGSLAEGESFDFTFDQAGEFDYFCSVHPEMQGSITVEG